MSADIKLSKAQIKKIIMSGGALGSVLRKLIGPLTKAVVPLAKNVLMALGVSAAISGIDHGIAKKVHRTGTTVIFSDEETNDMVKIVKALEDADVLMKGVSETLKNDVQKGNALPILPMLLGTLGSSFIGNLLTGKGMYRTGFGNNNKCNCGQGMYRTGQNQGKGLYKIGQGSQKKKKKKVLSYFK